jgi:hypothetical protein
VEWELHGSAGGGIPASQIAMALGLPWLVAAADSVRWRGDVEHPAAAAVVIRPLFHRATRVEP